jgi:hypothetical protein
MKWSSQEKKSCPFRTFASDRERNIEPLLAHLLDFHRGVGWAQLDAVLPTTEKTQLRQAGARGLASETQSRHEEKGMSGRHTDLPLGSSAITVCLTAVA